MNQMKKFIYFYSSHEFLPFAHQLGNSQGPLGDPQIAAALGPYPLGEEE